MNKLLATILKDFLILFRDKIGLTFMFLMPVVLVILITGIQNSAFELVSDNKLPIIISNKDTGEAGSRFIETIEKIGMFNLISSSVGTDKSEILDLMNEKDVLLAIVIPEDFSQKINSKARNISDKALKEFGISEETDETPTAQTEPLVLYYHPVLKDSYRYSIKGALRSALQIIENKQILKTLYFSLNESDLPESLESDMTENQITINEVPVTRDGNRGIPNATQHNIPAWTIFAMFFIVISLGNNVVKEKRSGSFLRLKTLPTSYLVSLFSKQITYLLICLIQVIIIFSLGVLLFPLIDLPKLEIPSDLTGLFIVSVISGWCAVSYAMCVGIFFQTQEQANGFGAISIILLAAIGGILVPAFAMPASFKFLLNISPLHWALESYYVLFLEGGKSTDLWTNIIPLLGITVILQLLSFIELKRKNLI